MLAHLPKLELYLDLLSWEELQKVVPPASLLRFRLSPSLNAL